MTGARLYLKQDYEPLSRGWPWRSLLLAEVITPSGEHHLVLVVRTETVGLFRDNLNPNLRPVGATIIDYERRRIESADHPLRWSTVSVPN